MNPRERKYFRQGTIHGQEYGEASRADAACFPQSLAQIYKLPAEEAVRRVVADYERRLDALPSLTKYPEMKGMRECLVAYNRGYAKGAGITEKDVAVQANHRKAITALTCCSKPETARVASSVSSPGCTRIFFPTSDRGSL